jgi:glycogen operon protein
MLSHGDEMGRTQLGNNNAYCHDSPLTWVDWTLTPAQQELLQFTRKVFAVRAASPLLRRATYFSPEPHSESGVKEVTWLTPDGREMGDQDWRDSGNHVLGMLLRSGTGQSGDQPGEALLLLLNGGGRARQFSLPAMRGPGQWAELITTADAILPRRSQTGIVQLSARSLILLRYQDPG